MDTSNLLENHQKLISHMKENGYTRTYIGEFLSTIKEVLRDAEPKNWFCYSDAYQEYERKGLSGHALDRKRWILGAIERFDLYGIYPGNGRKLSLIPRAAYYSLCPEYAELIDHYRSVAKCRGKRESTIDARASSTSVFLLVLQQSGVVSLNELTQKDVLSTFRTPDGSPPRGHTFKMSVSTVFKTCEARYPESSAKVLALLPALRPFRKNIQYLTADEIAKIKEALFDDGNQLSLRDKAMGIIALYTGMRGSDIAGLTLDAFDWERDLISTRQQKTGEPLELPMRAVVGNAVFDYLRFERPSEEHRYVFVSQVRPYGRMSSAGIGNVAKRIMRAADVRQKPGDRQGFHLFRHRLATTLLGNCIPPPVISRILGQVSPNSLDSYLSADFLHLKECSISIERFPVAKGVFGHG